MSYVKKNEDVVIHKDLEVYKESIVLVKYVYEICRSFTKEEMFGLTSQMKRASLSIPSNIAEGCGRRSNKELLNFLNKSLGSLSEIETQVDIALMLSFIKDPSKVEHINNSIIKTRKLMLGLIKSIKHHLDSTHKG